MPDIQTAQFMIAVGVPFLLLGMALFILARIGKINEWAGFITGTVLAVASAVSVAIGIILIAYSWPTYNSFHSDVEHAEHIQGIKVDPYPQNNSQQLKIGGPGSCVIPLTLSNHEIVIKGLKPRTLATPYNVTAICAALTN